MEKVPEQSGRRDSRGLRAGEKTERERGAQDQRGAVPSGHTPGPVLLPGKFHGQRSLACDSPWGRSRTGLSDYYTHREDFARGGGATVA